MNSRTQKKLCANKQTSSFESEITHSIYSLSDAVSASLPRLQYFTVCDKYVQGAKHVCQTARACVCVGVCMLMCVTTCLCVLGHMCLCTAINLCCARTRTYRQSVHRMHQHGPDLCGIFQQGVNLITKINSVERNCCKCHTHSQTTHA